MKKQYQSPRVVMEAFSTTEISGGCTAVQISAVDTICVLQDSDSTPTMLDFAFYGGFLETPGCQIAVPSVDEGDQICYHTSSAMAFTS